VAPQVDVSDIDKHASLSLKERHHHNKEFLDRKHKLGWSLYSEFTLSFRQKILFLALCLSPSVKLWRQDFCGNSIVSTGIVLPSCHGNFCSSEFCPSAIFLSLYAIAN
jgi:hypothetical protein